MKSLPIVVQTLVLSLLLTACEGGRKAELAPRDQSDNSPASSSQGRHFFIEPGDDASLQMVLATIDARPGDVIEFAAGYFELESGLQISSTEQVTVRGAGIDKTVLSFKNSSTQEGVLATSVRGFMIEDMTLLDSPGDGIKLQGVDHGTVNRVRTMWSSGRKTEREDLITAANYRERIRVACTDPATHNPDNPNPLETDTSSPDYTVSTSAGRYGIYPVNSQNILIDGAESIGASDAGIYVGQTNNAIIRNSRAAFNVFGFEIENVQHGEYEGNLAECNTGGFLVYDLDGLTQYGSKTRMYRNVSRNNNTYNFAVPGTVISEVPRGTGMITLAYDRIDVFDNVIEDNSTAGLLHLSYDLLGEPGDKRIDKYAEGLHVYRNTFRHNGYDITQPDFAALVATGGDQVSTAFPMLVGLKIAAASGQYRGSHVMWDGYMDAYNPDCPYPTDDQGQPIPRDEDGKPIQGNQYPNPSCRYNAYKFDDQGERIKPLWWASCIDADNDFSDDSERYANFHGTAGIDLLLHLNPNDPAGLLDYAINDLANTTNFPASLDMTPHDCPSQYGANLPPIPPVVIPPFTPSGNIDPAPSDETVARLCNATVASGEINAEAYAVNCPRLDQYHLFSDPVDPRSLPNGRGVPFMLNSKLFSDFATKYRVAYIPEGRQAIYRDGQDGANATILFPVGTILAKTFAFPDEPSNTEMPIETRLLIKRSNKSEMAYWEGLEYVWTEDNGKPVAKLTQEGGVANVSWDYHDVNSSVHKQGSSQRYQLPNASQCQMCHANDDAETGTAPIGPKPRNLNRAFASDSPVASGVEMHAVAGQNQLNFWCANGLMMNCPDLIVDPISQVATNIEHNAIYNVPGSSGHVENSPADIESRARAWLESNCAHCHNSRGLAQNTGFYLDVFRPVDDTYGICKGPTASGSEGRGGREFDIVPGSAADSILSFRIGPEATSLAARMPPLARHLVDHEAAALINRWIDEVIDETYPNADACANDSGFSLPSL